MTSSARPRQARRIRIGILVATIAFLPAISAADPPAEAVAFHNKPARTTAVQVLSIGDFHGSLEAPDSQGGAAYLGSLVRSLRDNARHSAFVSAGDLVSGSPFLSALFNDEPTIEAMNRMDLDLNVVGNHEFDRGLPELRRLERGGCTKDTCLAGHRFRGADFPMLAANVYDRKGRRIFKPYRILHFGKVRVAVIGIATTDTPGLTVPGSADGLRFGDEASAVNSLVPRLERRGVKAIVAVVHGGGTQTGTDPNACDEPTAGQLFDIHRQLDPQVDVLIGGHTHTTFVCESPRGVQYGKSKLPRLIVSSGALGRFLTDIELTINNDTGDIVAQTAITHSVTRDLTPAPDLVALVDKYKKIAGPLGNAPVGRITGDLPSARNADMESVMGSVIADAQLAATRGEGAVAAFQQYGGVRAGLSFASSPEGEGDGVVTVAESFAVHPFGNWMVTMTLSGHEIVEMLEQQFDNPTPGNHRSLSPSEGFSYAWDAGMPKGGKVVKGSVKIDGQPLDPAKDYRITVNNFLASGGGGMSIFLEGRDVVPGVIDLEALRAHLASDPAGIAPPPFGRARRVN